MNLEVHLFQILFTNYTNEFGWKIRPRRDSNPRLPDPMAGSHLRWVRSYLCATRSLGFTSTSHTYIHTNSTSQSTYTREFLFSSNHKSDVWAVIYCIYYLVTHIYQMKAHPGSVYRPMHTLTHVLCLHEPISKDDVPSRYEREVLEDGRMLLVSRMLYRQTIGREKK